MKAFFQAIASQQFFGFALGGVKGDAHLADGCGSCADLAQFVLQAARLLNPVAWPWWSGLGPAAQPFGLAPHLVGQPFLQLLLAA